MMSKFAKIGSPASASSKPGQVAGQAGRGSSQSGQVVGQAGRSSTKWGQVVGQADHSSADKAAQLVLAADSPYAAQGGPPHGRGALCAAPVRWAAAKGSRARAATGVFTRKSLRSPMGRVQVPFRCARGVIPIATTTRCAAAVELLGAAQASGR